jgi:hypothetical protein
MWNFLKRMCHEPRGGDLPKRPAGRIMQQATGKSDYRPYGFPGDFTCPQRLPGTNSTFKLPA